MSKFNGMNPLNKSNPRRKVHATFLALCEWLLCFCPKDLDDGPRKEGSQFCHLASHEKTDHVSDGAPLLGFAGLLQIAHKYNTPSAALLADSFHLSFPLVFWD